MASDDTPEPDDDTRILRRAPRNTGAQPSNASAEPETGIIRRHPTGAQPAASADPETQAISAPPGCGIVPRAKPTAIGPARPQPADAKPAIATAVVTMLSGWGTSVIATDLITAWWATDPLFCVAVGFLAAIAAAASISGVIALLLRRRTARLLIVVGSVISLLIFASLFVAGATLPVAVYALPVLPLASIVLAALPGTARWSRS